MRADKDCELYVKPSNHEVRKKKKYRTDISCRENMAYDPITVVSCAGAHQRSRRNGRSWLSRPISSSSILNSKMIAWEQDL